jgi:hypothetical protein
MSLKLLIGITAIIVGCGSPSSEEQWALKMPSIIHTGMSPRQITKAWGIPSSEVEQEDWSMLSYSYSTKYKTSNSLGQEVRKEYKGCKLTFSCVCNLHFSNGQLIPPPISKIEDPSRDPRLVDCDDEFYPFIQVLK